MKKFVTSILAAAYLVCWAASVTAETATNAASGGTNVSADLAQNGVAPAFTTLGSVVIAESQNNDFKTSGTLVLTAPSGWRFNTAAAISATPGKVGAGSTPIDISASVGAITASSITINITVNAAARLDNLTLGGIQIQATEGGSLPVAGNILRSSADPGTAVIVGISNDVTNFAALSQALGALRLHVVLPGQSFTDGSSVASSGISGAASNQAAGVSFNLVELVAADREFNVASSYSGAKTIAYVGPGGVPSYTTSVSFSGGHSTTALATTLRKAETVALSATSATSPAISTALPSSSFVVDAGPVAKLQILLPGETAAPGTSSGKTGSPAAVGVAILNNVRVNAVDADWNPISGAAPDVTIGSSDAAAAIADDNGAAGGNLSLVAGSGTLSSFTFSTGGAPQTVTASDFAAALGANTSASVTVNKSPSATSLSSSPRPSAFGQSVTFTAAVTGASGTPAGTVDFKDGSTVIGNDVPLDGSGVASFTTSSLTVATHTITAVYSGSAIYNASTSANLSQVVSKAGTATALASSLNPSCSGQPVTLTAVVSVVAPGSGVPTGNVDFKDGSNVIGSNIPLNASGVATYTTSSLSANNHNLTAVYKGSGSFNTSTSTPVLVQAVKAKPTASVSGSTSICPGGSASIRANLGGTGPWTVTWSDGVVQSGVAASPATRSASPSATTTFTLTSVVDAYCSNVGSGSATVTVNALPAISAQPSPKSVCEGGSATFTVAASGTGITYRWRKDGVNLVNGGHVSGATSATLTISSAAAADAGSYDVVVTGACPPAQTSNAVSLTVNPPPVSSITAVSKVCAGSAGNSASVADAGPGASYAWSIDSGTITGGAGTASITYTAGSSGNSLTLNVTVTSANGCATSSSKAVAMSTGDVVIEHWKNIPLSEASWQSATLSAKDMTYPEGGTVPYRLTMPQPCVGGTWSITLQYDFVDVATGVHFCDFLTSYNAYEASANGNACMGDTCTGESTFPIPADGDLSYQLPGVFTVENGAITSVSAYSTDLSGGNIQKFITLNGTANPGANLIVLFGAHIARDYEWGYNKGAHEWPSGTATLGFINYSAGTSSAGQTNVKISDNIVNNPSQSDLSVVATDSPDPVSAGQNLTYNIIVNNSGPLSSSADTLTDAIPAGTTFVSATCPAGWTMTTPAVGGTGTVRWILPTSFNAGASAAFGLVVAVDAGAVGSVETTATLTAGNADAYQTNNSSHTSTTILGACSMPVVASAPASASVMAGANASFSASASGSPAPTIQWQMMPSGGSFSDLAGETGATLSFVPATSQDGNQYRARFSNQCGTVFSSAATLTVTPASAPVVMQSGPVCGSILAIGTALALNGSFTDAAAGTHTASWQLDQVVVSGTVDETTHQVSGSYSFSSPGVYLMGLTVSNQQSGLASGGGGTNAMVVVFDPRASFVAGYGSMESPAGAWAADSSATGQASFGFETRGTSLRPSQCEIHFAYADMVFHSTSCDRIAVSGGSAWLTGSGTVNGEGDFAFLLSMVDGKFTGGSDRFRMKVTDRSNGNVIYDSQRGEPETAAAASVPTCNAVELYTTRGVLAARAESAGEPAAPAAAEISSASAPAEFAFPQNFPNPFVASTRLRFDLPVASRVRISVYDMLGREVANVVDGPLPAGQHEQVWQARSANGGPLSAGVYFVRMRAAGLSDGKAFSMQRRLVVLP